MNHSLIVPNFRDVGDTVNVLSGQKLMREGVLFRGGELDLVRDLAEISNPKTIINLRKCEDPTFSEATVMKFPAPDSKDVYLTKLGINRKWIVEILQFLAAEEALTPWFVHCAAGKDRTGVIVGAILTFIGIERPTIEEDYQLSAGPLHPELFAQTLDAFAEPDYFRKLNRDAVIQRLREA